MTSNSNKALILYLLGLGLLGLYILLNIYVFLFIRTPTSGIEFHSGLVLATNIQTIGLMIMLAGMVLLVISLMTLKKLDFLIKEKNRAIQIYVLAILLSISMYIYKSNSLLMILLEE